MVNQKRGKKKMRKKKTGGKRTGKKKTEKKTIKKKKTGGKKKAGGGYWVLGFLLLFLGLFVLNTPQEGITGAVSLEITPVQNTIIGVSFILGGLFLIGLILFMSRVKDKGIVQG